MKMQILVYVTTAPIEAPFTHWGGFFSPLWLSVPAHKFSLCWQSPQHGESRQKCPVMSPCAFISHLFGLSFWNFPLQLCSYSKYFLLLNLLSECRPLSSKYCFHVNISSFSLCGHLKAAVQNEVQSLCL